MSAGDRTKSSCLHGVYFAKEAIFPVLRLSYITLLANFEATISLPILPSPPIPLPQFLLWSFPFQFQIMIEVGKEKEKKRGMKKCHTKFKAEGKVLLENSPTSA